MPEYRSVSQLKQYEQCPLSYKLDRIDKVWNRPAAWLDHGTAVHKAVEEFWKSGGVLTLEDAVGIASEAYSSGINRLLEETPNADVWFSSGRYRGFADIERRAEIVPEMVERFYQWAAAHPDYKVWEASDGTPGVEIGFDVEIGGVRVRGFIDLVMTDPEGRVVVVDVKTGAQPGDEFQLAVYGQALKIAYGVDVATGYYWMGKTGRLTRPYDLSIVPLEEIEERFRLTDDGIRNGRFDPRPGDHCRRCPVATSCPAV